MLLSIERHSSVPEDARRWSDVELAVRIQDGIPEGLVQPVAQDIQESDVTDYGVVLLDDGVDVIRGKTQLGRTTRFCSDYDLKVNNEELEF